MRLIPAHAGKTSSLSASRSRPWAHPRSCGDNLLLVLPSGSVQGSSPLVRGKQPGTPRGQPRARLIPAHAGKTRIARRTHCCRGAHPRSCEENSQEGLNYQTVTGSPPLTRGKPSRPANGSKLGRLIPAHAGKTQASRHRLPDREAHPRSRGENSTDWRKDSKLSGSSPLTRGKLLDPIRINPRKRLIPAHAGKTSQPCSVPAAGAAHPRSRGENHVTRDITLRGLGSSPLTRGKPKRAGVKRDDGRLIPAHAGKTPNRCPVSFADTAHPRSRGENHTKDLDFPSATGSSPLTRGKHGMRGPLRRPLGLIPAHAGKTVLTACIPLATTAHPRSRGENFRVSRGFPCRYGSSPLTRGKPDRVGTA